MCRWILCFVLLLGVAAADWRQWRGFSRNGMASHRVDFDKLPAQLHQEWELEVGTGYASPLISGKRVFVFSRRQGREVLRAVDLASGKQIWESSYPAPFKQNSYAKDMQDG